MSGSNGWAQSQPRSLAEEHRSEFAPQTRTIQAADGLQLALTYWPSEMLENAPVVVLVHDAHGSRQDWPMRFLTKLHEAGYAVVAPDLRGHGDSRDPRPPILKPRTIPAEEEEAVHLDLGAVKQFIFEENQRKRLNMGKMAMIGAGLGAHLSLLFAADDWLLPPFPDGPIGFETRRGQDVRALVLLSPVIHPGGTPTVPALDLLKNPAWNISFLVMVGSRNPESLNVAQRVENVLTRPIQNMSRAYLEPVTTRLQGTSLLQATSPTEQYILAFLERRLMSIQEPWENRANRVGRPWLPRFGAQPDWGRCCPAM